MGEPGTARVNVSTDGEVSILDTPLHYRIRPHALGVVVPRLRDRNCRATATAALGP